MSFQLRQNEVSAKKNGLEEKNSQIQSQKTSYQARLIQK
jgi:FtsZ-binding cell division protein ZapB